MVNKRNILSAGAASLLGALSLSAVAQDAPKAPEQNPGAAQARPQRGQGQRGQGQRGGRVSLATLPVKALDTALKLSDDQKTKITAIQDKYRTDAQALRPAQGAQPDPANREKLRDLSTKANSDIEAILTKEQNDKVKDTLKELTSLARAGIQPALALEQNLTADQKTKIAAIAADVQQKTQGGGDRRAAMEEARTKVDAILTTEQKAARDKFMAERGRNRRRPNP